MSSDFKEKLEEYLDNVSKDTNEASKTYRFLNFISTVFQGVEADYAERRFPKLEKYIKSKMGTVIVSGRVDVFLGNLVIEFESDLTKTLEEAKEQLRRYVAILWSDEKHRIEWLTIASDGLNFCVFRPRTSVALGEPVITEEVILEEVDRSNLLSMLRKQGTDWIYVWLDRYLLYRTLIPPTTEEFAEDFGLGSSAFRISNISLKEAWDSVKGTGVGTIYQEWARYLEIVYGGMVESEDLFIRHTYLATLAKLMAFMFYSGGALPSLDEVEKIISGDIFKEWGIYGFLEEDFFSWILKEGVKDRGLRVIMDLLGRLKRYDLTMLEEDVLKGLYQELVDPEERHDLGEYYTPDWLAENIVRNVLCNLPNGSVLDPACGSGTFLVSSINYKRKHLIDELSPENLLNHILSSVVGIDVHPLAVITSKVNFLLALGELVRKYRRGTITIPVYMSDSINLPEEIQTLDEGVIAYVVKGPGNRRFLIPELVAEDAELHDEVIQIIREYVKVSASGDYDQDKFSTLIKMKSQRFSRVVNDAKLEKPVIRSLFRTALTMAELQRDGEDTIWAFILKNLFKPLYFFSRNKKFDFLVGNPPWLSYRYVVSEKYQKELKKFIVERYRLLPSEKAELITQMELASLFFLRASDLYLNANGLIGFVMPRSVFSADQHDNFRSGTFIRPNLGFTMVFDLLGVKPLFNVPASAFFAKVGIPVRYPIDVVVFSGILSKRNCGFEEAQGLLNERKSALHLGSLGKRSFLTEKPLNIPKRRSDYYNDIYDGATVYPRQFWFVDIVSHPKFGVNIETPYVRTSKKASDLAQKQYEDLVLEGNVESQFLYGILTGSEIVPFGHLDPKVVISPVEPKANVYHLINAEEAESRGLSHLADWLSRVEVEWIKRRSEKASKSTSLQWLNYQQKLTQQNPRAKYNVIYNASGTYLVSAVLRKRKTDMTIDGRTIELNGIIIDHKLYHYETNNQDEAFYLSTVLNSGIIDDSIKDAQSRGDFGPRDIHKKPLEFYIPKYDSKSLTICELSELGKKCSTKVEKLLPALVSKYDSIGYIRRRIKEELGQEIDHIDEIVLKLFEEYESRNTLPAFA